MRPLPQPSLNLCDVLGGLIHALDLAEGQPLGHGLRSCLIAMRLSARLGLPEADRADLYYASLLKDAGCSSNADRVVTLLRTEDQLAKRTLKGYDWTSFGARLAYGLQVVDPAGAPLARARRLVWLARQPDVQAQLVGLRCERGAAIALRLGASDASAEAIRGLDEHWDGHGRPRGLAGERIPRLSRILCLAQTAEVFLMTRGRAGARRVVRRRRGRWFDPEAASAFAQLGDADELWQALAAPPGELEAAVHALRPPPGLRRVATDGLDGVTAAFAGVVDAKSPYTARHSARVAELTDGVAERLGVRDTERRVLRRIALLHDIGKLGIPNTILDKPGPLTAPEFARVRRHPVFTREVLRRVPRLADLADAAGAHHERLDGSGYPDGRRGEEIPVAARLVAVADVFESLTAARPYRAALAPADALALMRGPAGRGLGRDALAALSAFAAGVAA